MMMAGPRRRAAGQRDAGRRHVSLGHDAVGETQHLGQRAGVEAGDLHPVRQLRDGLSARGDPRTLLRRVGAGRGAGGLRVCAARRARLSRTCGSRCRSRSRTAPAASCASRSARPGASKPPASAPSTWKPKAPILERERRNLAFFATLPDNRPAGLDTSLVRGIQYPDAPVRVFGRLRGLRRDAVSAAAHAAVRRPAAGRERDRLLFHLRRQPADDAVGGEQRGPRPRVGQLAVRRQRGVRARLPARARQAPRAGRGAAEGARAGARHRPRRRNPGCAADHA